MKILRDSAEQQILKPLHTHGWDAKIQSASDAGEYIIVSATKATTTKKVALMYSSATSNAHYKALDALVDHIFTNGALYHIEQYAYGIDTPVEPVDGFFSLLVSWNKDLAPPEPHSAPEPRTKSLRRRTITSENPLDAVWMHLKQFASSQNAHKLVTRRAADEGVSLDVASIASKAEGVAFTLRNAVDYLREPNARALNGRILRLYYGTLALAFAEMLASPQGPGDLDEVEGFTKFGHGLYTLSGSGDLGSLHVGALATGFFPRWVSFVGHDVSLFPKAKAKSEDDIERLPPNSSTTLEGLMTRVPELGELLYEVLGSAPRWVTPHYDSDSNPSFSLRRAAPKTESTYIQFFDYSNKVEIELLQQSPWPLAEIQKVDHQDAEAAKFRARVDHPGYEYWHEALPIHHSSYLRSGALIMPVFGTVSEYRCSALALLYALSIVVRYMPSAWRRVEGGDWDRFLPLVEMAVEVFERVLPEEFLGKITGDRVHTRQPGSLF